MKMLRPFLGSLLLHGLLAATFFLPRFQNPVAEPDNIEIQWLPSRGGSFVRAEFSKEKAEDRAQKARARSVAQKLLKARDYETPSDMSPSTALGSQDGAWEEDGYTRKDNPNIAWGAGAGTFDRVQDYALMERLHRKTDALLFYPGILARHKISGGANTRIVLDKDGECDWKRTKISAGDPHLRVFVLHLLKNICTENFKKYLAGRESTNIDMSFLFSITERPTTQELIRQNQKIVSNFLLFYRNSHQSIAEWHVGPFRGMFPIPFVHLDFDWILENFDKYVRKSDPMREYSEPRFSDPS